MSKHHSPNQCYIGTHKHTHTFLFIYIAYKFAYNAALLYIA